MSTTNFLSKLTLVLFLFGIATSISGQKANQLKAVDHQLQSDIAMYKNVWHEIINERKIDQINTDHFDSNITMILSPENIVGIEGFKAYYQNFLTGFSDIQFTISDIFGNKDKVAKHWRFQGTHTGDFFGIPPTGKKVDVSGATIAKMKNGKIAQEEDFIDNMVIMQQLGILSNPANVSIIDGLYQSFAKGDVPDVLSRLDGNVVWNEAEGNALADGNPYIGPDAVLNGVFARVIGGHEYFNLKDIQLHDMSNNQVLSTLRYDGKVKSNGELYNAQAAHLWTLNDEGKVIAFQQYVDTKKLADAEEAGSLPMVMSHNFYLPVSTKSQIAKADYYKAALLGSQIRIGEAKALLVEAIEKDPDFFMAYALKIYYSSDKEREALIDKALAIDSKHFNKAEKNVRQQFVIWDKDPKASVAEELKSLVAAYPNTPQAYHWASANAAFNDKNTKAAIGYALKLAALSPDFGSTYNTLGYAYMAEKEMKKAKSAFENYLVSAPSEANPYDSMADYFMANKEYIKAAEYYDKAATKGMSSASERADKARAEEATAKK